MSTVIGLQYDEKGNPIVNGKAEKKYTDAELTAKVEKAKEPLMKENAELKAKIKKLEEAAKEGADQNGTKDPGSSDANSKGSKK